MVPAPAIHLVHILVEHVCLAILAARGRKEGGDAHIHNGEDGHHDRAISVGIFEELLDECPVADLSWSRPYRMGTFWKYSWRWSMAALNG